MKTLTMLVVLLFLLGLIVLASERPRGLWQSEDDKDE